MDEVDRPSDDAEPKKTKPFDMSNRILPRETGGEITYDEVDQSNRIHLESKRVKNSIISNTTTVVEDSIDVTVVSEGGNMNFKDTFDIVIEDEAAQHTVDIVNIEKTVHIDKVDSRPSKEPTSVGSATGESDAGQSNVNTDGPFDKMFAKPSKPINFVDSKTDREGITSSHTVYFPEPPSKHSNYKYSVNSDQFYDMKTFPRGRLTIINVKLFKRSSGMAKYPRHGTDRDADGLCQLFLELGFQVDRYDNPTKAEIRTALKAAASDSYSGLSCCACAILSHGEENIIYGTDEAIKISEITSIFKTKNLVGKPKIFLFQACQGTKYMDALDSVDGRGEPEGKQMQLPVEADFVYAYSTVPEYYSWRNSSRGSWFMESIITVFRDYAHKMDLMRMLMRVNAKMSYRKSRTDDFSTDNKRQIGSFVTQMRKEFFFFPPHGPLKPRD